MFGDYSAEIVFCPAQNVQPGEADRLDGYTPQFVRAGVPKPFHDKRITMHYILVIRYTIVWIAVLLQEM